MKIAQLLLEEVKELPSYLRITKLLRDNDDLKKWIQREIKAGDDWERSRLKDDLPGIPKVPNYRSQYPRFV